jgi:hypothetical protein
MADATTSKKHVAAWRASGETAAAYCELLTSSTTCPRVALSLLQPLWSVDRAVSHAAS